MSTLTRLHKRAEMAENQCALRLADCNRRHTTMHSQIEQLVLYHSEFTLPDANAALMLDAILFCQRLGSSIDEMKERLVPLSEELKQHQLSWQSARSRRQALEKLCEREQQHHALTRRKQRRQQDDSLVSTSAFITPPTEE